MHSASPVKGFSTFLNTVLAAVLFGKSLKSRRNIGLLTTGNRADRTEVQFLTHHMLTLSVHSTLSSVVFCIGSRPSDHYFCSLCLFVCAEFFSAVFDPISIKLGYMLHVWV